MKNFTQWLAAGLMLVATQSAFSQNQAQALPAQRVTLSASATVQVPQDELTLTLSTQREGSSAPEVQNQLKTALDAALTLARDIRAHVGRNRLAVDQFSAQSPPPGSPE